MKKRRIIKLEGETRRSWPEGGITGRETKGFVALGELAGSLMRDVIKRRNANR
jgi:hypothetical protein